MLLTRLRLLLHRMKWRLRPLMRRLHLIRPPPHPMKHHPPRLLLHPRRHR
jgi:hypothetical protein